MSHAANIAFQQDFRPYIFDQQTVEFPVLHLIDDYAFIGLDSNADEFGFFERFFAEGDLGEAQLERLNQLLDSDAVAGKKIIIYLHHHPFHFSRSVSSREGKKHAFKAFLKRNTEVFRRMKDAHDFLSIVRDRTDVLLFGHKHDGLDLSHQSQQYGIRLALDAGSSTNTDDFVDRMRIRVINLEELSYQTHIIKLSTG